MHPNNFNNHRPQQPPPGAQFPANTDQAPSKVDIVLAYVVTYTERRGPWGLFKRRVKRHGRATSINVTPSGFLILEDETTLLGIAAHNLESLEIVKRISPR